MIPDTSLPTRRARKKERTRQEIFSAAMDLFRARGFEAVTIEAICEAADVARATFFLHFPTKASLLHEWNCQVAADFSASLREPRGSAVDELRGLVEHISGRLRAQADVMAAMLNEFFTTPQAVSTARAAAQDLHALFESIIRRGQARGELRSSVDPRLAVAVVLSTSAAILSGQVWKPGELPPEQVQAQFFEVVFHGLTGDPT
ncbi:MAG: TetR family transcriptional regulator [Myxococcota bacterium]